MSTVLQVIASTNRRGAEVFAFDLGSELQRRGHDVRTVALADGHSASRLPVEVLGSGASPRSARTLKALSHASREASVVVAHGSSTLEACSIACLRRPPFIYRSIGDLTYWASHGVRRVRSRVLLHRAAWVVALWDDAAQVLATQFGVDRARLEVIPNAVDSERFVRPSEGERTRARAELGIAADQRVALYVGSLSPEKNVGLAIAAVGRVDGVQLLVIGDGPERSGLERLARQRGANVRFLGSMTDPTVGLTAADALVLPSRTEGMSGVLLEAAMCGLPAIVTDVGAAREVVVDGRSGVVVPADDEQAFAEAIRSVLSNGSTYAVDRDDLVKRFDLQVAADSWSQLIERAASGARP